MTKYKDKGGIVRTLTHVQAHLLRKAKQHQGHWQSPDPVAARLLEERGLIIREEWHCSLHPRCITGITPLGDQVRRAAQTRPRPLRREYKEPPF